MIFSDTFCIRDVWEYFPGYEKSNSLNFYYTPANGQGMRGHRDGYDIRVVQLLGSKFWRLPDREFWLREGEEFLLPKGTFHECRTGDDPSAHLAVGSIPG